MLRTIGAALLLSSLMAASAHPLAPQGERMAAPVRAGVRVTQSTCLYVVLYCKKSKADVENWKQMNGGEVINTSSDEFPGFTPGFYCAVVGPLKSPPRRNPKRRNGATAPRPTPTSRIPVPAADAGRAGSPALSDPPSG
jgi:hypothetical protein